MTTRPPIPPIDEASAHEKVRAAEDAWNSRDPGKVALAYSSDSRWRNRSAFIRGRADIERFLTRKWKLERDYRLIKEFCTFSGNRIAVRFAYEWHNAESQWFRSFGNENREFAPSGLMQRRIASINDLAIGQFDREFRWPLGPRPLDHRGLSELGL